ncbi:exosome complex component MTR3 isoform X2 [Hydra vulgaris]|uniref:Exosome complex component MTR3 isoform X2 n=1 Tax=Hydra vulgaris TaxID=6087 RepID=A0ABM4C6I8_HYDVU
MPIQHSKRLKGPQETLPLTSLSCKITTSAKSCSQRQDGRGENEIRPMYLKAGTIHQANGSSYVETCDTKLICAVYGPRDNPKRHQFSSKGNIFCEVTFAPFSWHERVSNQDSLSREYSSAIVQAFESAVCLESYPKAQIDIYINILEYSGNCLSYAFIAASIALADAGIEMLDLVTSCETAFSNETSIQRVCVDPSSEEISHSKGRVVIAYMPSLNKISYLSMQGEETIDDSMQNVIICIEGCLRIYKYMKECIMNWT